MIVRLLALLVRVLLETAVVFLGVAVVLLVVAWRASRRVITEKPDRLDRLSGNLGGLLTVAGSLVELGRRMQAGQTEPDRVESPS